MKLVEVLIEHNIKIDSYYTYLCNDQTNIKIGCRVYVPFNTQNIVGYVINIKTINCTYDELCKNDNIKYKFINNVIDEEPILNDELFNLAKYMEKEYVSPLIYCLQTILPPSYKPKSTALKQITYKKIKKVYVNENASLLSLKDYQIELYNQIKNNNGIFYKDLSSSKVNTLIKKNILYIKDEIVNDDYFKDYKSNESNVILNDEQQQAFNTIINTKDSVYLLQGVTGSGKTEVYIKLVEYYLSINKTAIILVPEISLTPMIIQRFKSKFKDIAIWHGSLSKKEKQVQYDKIRNHEAKVVIGARSAIFSPLENIGIIILDEEQSTSYKQDKSPTYHAKDIAIYRAKHHNAKVVLGSATPSFESKARAMKGVYKIVYLRNRANKLLPNIKVVNMRNDMSDFSSLISSSLDKAINECLNKNEKIIILQNRRGYSPYVFCRSCNYTFKCPNCELNMSYHKSGDKFKCHYCNYEIKFNHICPKCNSTDFLFMGSGTQKIEEVLSLNYPKAKLLRMDNDTTSIKNGHLKILEKFKSDEYNVLIGTQMVAKGLDFHDVTLVGVINADSSLNVADFRSGEFTFELLSQVAGRAGRGKKQGDVIIQTFNPTNYVIKFASSQEYDLFYQVEMKFRNKMNYPPFSYMAAITILSSKADQVCILADKLFEELKKETNFELLGPAFPYLYKENDKIRIKILIKSKKHDLIIERLNTINKLFAKEAKERNCSIQYDIDIYQLL